MSKTKHIELTYIYIYIYNSNSQGRFNSRARLDPLITTCREDQFAGTFCGLYTQRFVFLSLVPTPKQPPLIQLLKENLIENVLKTEHCQVHPPLIHFLGHGDVFLLFSGQLDLQDMSHGQNLVNTSQPLFILRHPLQTTVFLLRIPTYICLYIYIYIVYRLYEKIKQHCERQFKDKTVCSPFIRLHR